MPTPLPPYPIIPPPDTTAPPYVPPPSPQMSPIPTPPPRPNQRQSANRTARRAIEYQQQISALNEPWSLVYGQAIVGGRILAWAVTTSTLYLSVGWCAGGSNGIHSVVEIYESNRPLPATVTVTNYLGTTSQTADATMAAQIPGYVDTNVMEQAGQSMGIAYSVFAFPATTTTAFPRLSAKIRGLKANAGAWTDNPARCLANFISSSLYGQGKTVDAASVTAAADYCDEDLGGGVKRSTIGLILDRPQRCEQWVQVLREYALCFVVAEGGTIKLIPDKAGTSARSIGAADMVAGSFRASKRSLQQAPTVVTVRYTDVSGLPWRDRSATAKLSMVDEGLKPFRESLVNLPGIKSHEAAMRKAIMILNGFSLVDFDAEWDSYDDQLDVQIGDIVDITHPHGPSGKLMRVVDIRPGRRAGLWHISAREHNDLIYSNDIIESGSEPDSSLPSPTEPPVVTGLTMTEAIYTNQANRVASRFVVEWTGVDWPFARSYRVRVLGAGMAYTSLETHLGAETHSIETPPVKEETEYTATVFTISTTGHRSAGASINATALGRFIPPPDVAGFSGFDTNEFVSLHWNSVTDIGIVKYRIKRGDATDTWDTTTFSPPGGALISGTFFLDRLPSPGTYRYMVKAVDDVGLESENEAVFDIVVEDDPARLILENSFPWSTAVTQNMHTYYISGDAGYAVTDVGDTWADRFGTSPGTWSGTYWFEGHGLSAGDAFVRTPDWDAAGVDKNGRWSYQAAVTLMGSGAAVGRKILLATSAAYSTFTETTGNSRSTTARYMRAKLLDNGGANTRGLKVKFPITAQFQGRTVEQTGTALVSASPQPLAITFPEPYAATPKLTVQFFGGNAKFSSYAALTATGFDAYVWDDTGAASGGNIRWIARGI